MTQQCRAAVIQFALFLADLFLDGREFFLERVPRIFLLLEQLLFLCDKFGELLIGMRHFFSLDVFHIQPPESRSPSLDRLDLPVRQSVWLHHRPFWIRTMSGLSRSFIPARPVAKPSTVPTVSVQYSFPVSAAADSPRSPSLYNHG